MIHSQDTINQIKLILRNSGVRNKEILEEMTDHYLTEIEQHTDSGIALHIAITTTIEKIEQADLTSLKTRNSRARKVFATLIVFTLVILHLIYPYGNVDNTELVETNTELVPDGWPITDPSVSISSRFGMRIHPVFKTQVQHKGIDIAAPIGTPVVATGNAVVQKVGFNKNAGKFIILQHNERYTSKFYHLSSIEVEENQEVRIGDIIGKVGNTGLSSLPHLHYEIIDADVPIDPLACIKP